MYCCVAEEPTIKWLISQNGADVGLSPRQKGPELIDSGMDSRRHGISRAL